MFKGITAKEFRDRFKTEQDCFFYLMEIKWGKGFKCSRCGHDQFYKGRTYYYRRCRSCRYDESVTANTLFHNCKLGILKAFEIAFRISVRKKGMSSCELSKEVGCNQKSAWLFKSKLQEAMKSSELYPLTGKVDVDEFAVGGLDQESQGRSKGDKKIIVVGIERVKDKKNKETIGRAYCKVIENYSSVELSKLFHSHISEEAKVRTDKWTGYIPLKEEFSIQQKYSNNGSNFKLIHIHIMNIKNWLRGIHHKCSERRIQKYLDEYHFRFNRRSSLKGIFNTLIQRAVQSSPVPYSLIVAN